MNSTLDEALNNATGSLTIEEGSTQPPRSQEGSDDGLNKAENQETNNDNEGSWKFSSVDPKTLAPELQEIYHNLNRGFTQNMQKKSEEIKALKAELDNLRSKMGNFSDNQQQPEKVDYSSMTPEQFAQQLRQQVVEQIKQDIRVERENEYIETAEAEFTSIDERLNPNSPNYDKFLTSAVVDILAEQRSNYEQEHSTILGFDFKGNAKSIIEEFDKQMAERYKQFVSQKQMEAKQNFDRTSKNYIKPSHSSSQKTKMSIDDAVSSAIEQAGL